MLYIGSDHGGFKLKAALKDFLKKKKVDLADLGAKKLVKGDDYPKYAAAVAKAVSRDPSLNKGILICRSGQGVCIAANRFRGVRAVLAWNEKVAKHSRIDDDANILCLPADFISAKAAEKIVSAWINAKFSFQKQYIRRLKELSNI